MELEGKIINYLGETGGTSKAGNPWKKKEWVLETFGQFPRKVKVQCFGDRADSLNLEPGKDYTLSIDIESREYNGRWYTDVSVYRATEYTGQAAFGSQPGNSYGAPQGAPAGVSEDNSFGAAPYGGSSDPFTPSENAEEDLPF